MNKKFGLSILLSLLLLCSCLAQDKTPSITGPTEVAINQPAWLSLELQDGATGKFDDKNKNLDINPAHIVNGAALFFASTPGEYRIIAVSVAETNITFLEKFISVKASVPPDVPTEQITKENVKEWLLLIKEEVRNEKITNPLNQTEMTRQQAIGQTFLNIGKASEAIGSIAGLELILSTALTPTLGDSASEWKSFADKVDSALSLLKNESLEEYVKAYIIIGETLINE